MACREKGWLGRCGCWKQREWPLHNAAALPCWVSSPGLSLHLHTSHSHLPEAPKQASCACVRRLQDGTQGIPDRNLLALLSHSPSTMVLMARVLDTAPWSLVCMVFCAVVGQHATPRRDFSLSLGPVVVPVATAEAR